MALIPERGARLQEGIGVRSGQGSECRGPGCTLVGCDGQAEGEGRKPSVEVREEENKAEETLQRHPNIPR